MYYVVKIEPIGIELEYNSNAELMDWFASASPIDYLANGMTITIVDPLTLPNPECYPYLTV